MPTPAKNKKARGVSLYNKILKQFTKINNQLPEDRKVSLKDRRSYISKEIYPKFNEFILSLPDDQKISFLRKIKHIKTSTSEKFIHKFIEENLKTAEAITASIKKEFSL